MTDDDEQHLLNAKVCHVCEKEYSENDKQVRDHCYITGKYRRSAHEACNWNFKLTDKIPVIFHNLRGYDSHLIMQQIADVAKKNTLKNKKGDKCQLMTNAILNNMEKYIAFIVVT